MSVKVTEKVTSDGKKFEKMLKQLNGLQVRVGFQKGQASDDNGVDICDIAAWNELGTEHTPARPFLRKSVDENTAEITSFIKSLKKELLSSGDAEQFLKKVGIFQKELIQKKITDGDFEPNAESTIKKKGSSKPLIDTGRMRQSVNYVIKSKGSDD
jgi:hypothetical protein